MVGSSRLWNAVAVTASRLRWAVALSGRWVLLSGYFLAQSAAKQHQAAVLLSVIRYFWPQP
jgi:hypothetical protein